MRKRHYLTTGLFIAGFVRFTAFAPALFAQEQVALMQQNSHMQEATVAGQTASLAPVALSYTGSTGYSLVERTNLRKSINGKYAGLLSREVRSFISPAENPLPAAAAATSPLSQGRWYDGSFYVLEQTKLNARATGGIHDSIPSVFNISQDGKLTMYQDNGYPTFRSFPAFTKAALFPGDTWKARAERAVDPMGKGIFTRLPMDVSYTFVGEEIYKEKLVYRIKAQWQTVYGMSTRDVRGDSTLAKAGGGHKADILVLKATGAAILIVDTVDETFVYTDGTTANFKGTINLFTEFPPAVDTQMLIPALQRIADGGAASPKSNIVVEHTPAGLRLSMRDVRFKPDSDEVLAGESERLDDIAAVLKLAPQSQFLIEGHTAAVGNAQGEQRLSEQRARRIAMELSTRGVDAAAFICRGKGGTKPIADNSTDSGRAQNRRVEITILE